MIMQLDRNGCKTVFVDVYCYNCSGDNYTKMNKGKGSGRMVMIKKTGNVLWKYKCIDCNYSFNYDIGYIGQYEIR